METIKYKYAGGTLKDVDMNKRIVTGYAAAFNNVDTDNDIFRFGSFAKTIKEQGIEGKNRITHLYQHDRTLILSKPYILKETPEGLYFESKIAQTSLGNDVLILYQEGILNEHSVGVNILQNNVITNGDKRHNEISEAKLWEFSTVTWGANELTPFLGVKNAKDLQQTLEKIENFLHSGKVTDETFLQLTDLQKSLNNFLLKQPDKQATAEQNKWLFLNSIAIL
jgi:HK97 family phage prohead protease